MPRDYVVPKDVETGGKTVPKPQQLRFVEGLKMGMLPEQAAKYAGSTDPARFVQRNMQLEWVQVEVKKIRDEMEQQMSMSRQKVQDMVVEAYDMAKIQAMPGDMIRACGELNKMLGYYAPEEKTINIKASRVQEELSVMDEEELLELAGMERDAIEGEFELLDEIFEEECNAAG